MCIEGKDNKETIICTHYSRGEKDDKYSSSNKSTLEDGILLSVSTDHSCVRMRHQANFTICEHITPRTTASCKSSMTCSVLGNFSLKHLS